MRRTRPAPASKRLIDRRDFMRAAGATFAAALAPRQLHAVEQADAVFATAYQEKDGPCGVAVARVPRGRERRRQAGSSCPAGDGEGCRPTSSRGSRAFDVGTVAVSTPFAATAVPYSR